MPSRHAGTEEPDGRDRFYRWLLLTGDRNVIVAGVTATVFVVALAVTGSYLPPERASAVPVLRISTAIAGGLLPFITLVLTINQLALSMELGSVFHLERRYDSMREFRGRVAELTDCDTSPAGPAELLETILDAIDDRTALLMDTDVDALADYGETLELEAATVQRKFSRDAGMLASLVATRRYNPGGRLHDVDRLQSQVGDEYDDVLDELKQLEEFLDVAQKYFWMVYIEDEMTKLARFVLYTGLVALLSGVALSLGTDHLLERGVDGWLFTLTVATGVTLELLPFAILFAYMLRIATVAGTSSGFGPFVTEGPGWD